MKHHLSSDGLRIAYRDHGTGPPLLCLAGLTCNSADFDDIAGQLPELRLICQDYRGRGDSEWDRNFRNYHIAVEARDAVELLDHLEIDSAIVLGTSRGGMVAMAISLAGRERVSGVIFNDIGPELEPGGLDRILQYLGRPPAARTLAAAAEALEDSAVGFENVPHSRWLTECRRRYVVGQDQLKLNYDPKLRDAVIDSFTQPAADLWPYFDGLNGIPLGLIRGANSDLLSPTTVGKMQSVRPDMRFLEVAGRGHCPFLDEPECLHFIRDFATDVASAA